MLKISNADSIIYTCCLLKSNKIVHFYTCTPEVNWHQVASISNIYLLEETEFWGSCLSKIVAKLSPNRKIANNLVSGITHRAKQHSNNFSRVYERSCISGSEEAIQELWRGNFVYNSKVACFLSVNLLLKLHGNKFSMPLLLLRWDIVPTSCNLVKIKSSHDKAANKKTKSVQFVYSCLMQLA